MVTVRVVRYNGGRGQQNVTSGSAPSSVPDRTGDLTAEALGSGATGD